MTNMADIQNNIESLELERQPLGALMSLLLQLSQRFGDRDALHGKAVDIIELPLAVKRKRYRVSWVTIRRSSPNYFGSTQEEAILSAINSFAPELVARCLRVAWSEGQIIE